MIQNYFKIALRNVRRNITYSVLNVIGMAVGMASAILIFLWVQDEWSYDRYLKNADDLYRIIEKDTTAHGQMMVPVPAALSKTLKEEYPQVIRSAKYTDSPLTLKKDDSFIEETVASVDKDFLKMFDIEFLDGDINTALDDPHNIILTSEMAEKYFGSDQALGKLIPSRGFDVKVTGVIKNFPHNSHLRLNFIMPIEWLKDFGANTGDWHNAFHTYVELKSGTDRRALEDKIRNLLKEHLPESHSIIFLQNVKKIHLYSSGKYAFDVSGHGDITYVRIMSLIAVLILIMASVNFMNLASAQMIRRSREAGMRKVSGASGTKIWFQFIGESLLLVFLAHIIAMIMAELLLPGFNSLTGKQVAINYQGAGLYLELVVLVLTCGLLAGIYPALYLSTLNPLDTVKGTVNNSPRGSGIRKSLVIFQFAVSVALIFCSLVISLQLKFVQTTNPGYHKDHVGYFMFPIRPGDPKLESLKNELVKVPGITGVTKGFNPVNIEGSINGFTWTGKKEGDIPFYFVGADANFASVFELGLKQGRFLSPEIAKDSFAVMINEQAARIMEFENPVGKTITAPWGARFEIIGVMKDFNFKSLHHTIEPLILQVGASNNFFVKMRPENTKTTVDAIDRTFKSFNPGLPINFHFLDADFDNLYSTERRMSSIFACFTFLAIVISVLGLIGLSSFMTESRTKEIGIRKTNGASAFEIFTFLSAEYITWVLIAILIAFPLAWYIMHQWLRSFAYRIQIPWWVFVAASLIALVIAVLTVSIQACRAAGKNTVEALRYE